jgi:sugar phosphate permease
MTDRRRWAVLVTGMAAMTASCALQFGLPFLIPALRADGLTLAQAGVVASAPVAGLLVTLIAWGAAADRWGERWVMTIGLGVAGLILLVAVGVAGVVPLAVCLFLAGASGAAVQASSGRLILRWFAARERGLAMGMRQTSLPLGVAIAALTLPVLSRPSALGFLAALCLFASASAALIVRDPTMPAAAPAGRVADAGRAVDDVRVADAGGAVDGVRVADGRRDDAEHVARVGSSPYRTAVLWRIHAASALLVVPQVTVATFALVYLVDDHGWPAGGAGRLLAAGQVGGALARLVAGWWSDRIGARLRPMRHAALAIAAVLVVLAAGTNAAAAVVALLAAGVMTVSPNGLAFTAVAERAGAAWAGRAMGVQNTAQSLVGTVTVPVMAAVIGAAGYGIAFAATIVFPLAAAAVIPVAAERARPALSSPPHA